MFTGQVLVGAADVMHGGAGTDTATYADRVPPLGQPLALPAPVTVTLDGVANDGSSDDLAPGSLGGPPLRDNVDATVENLTGGDGNDTLIGNSAANVLDGGLGFDHLQGQGGADRLEAVDGLPDFVRCGNGIDTADVDLKDDIGVLDTSGIVDSDCETILDGPSDHDRCSPSAQRICCGMPTATSTSRFAASSAGAAAGAGSCSSAFSGRTRPRRRAPRCYGAATRSAPATGSSWSSPSDADEERWSCTGLPQTTMAAGACEPCTCGCW